ncbi:hypothetical protein B0A53_04795 [Rhodotorula sp. CCFEE 5036]|nr:hypothetical protein B0A53_04795 [Rhodotorula sp. CCFEE 5036]
MPTPMARPVSSADLRRIDHGTLPPAPSPGGRHADAASGRVALKIGLERQCYVAGQQIRGVLEVHSKTKGLALGDIGIEFGGTEELRSRDHTSTRRLLTTRVDFQGNGLPPSNAVVPNARPVQAGFYPALPGRTRFSFVFDIPAEVPSSCTLGANAIKRYELRAFASSLFEGNVDIRTDKAEVRVVERWADWREGPWQEGLEKRAAEKLAVGGEDLLEIVVNVGRGDHVERPARLFWRGDPDLELEGKGRIEINATVRNLTKRHVTGFKVSLLRRLRILYPEDARPLVEPPVVTDSVTSERYHGSDYDVRGECERDIVLVMQVPKDEAWTVRRGSLFELDLVLRVEAECGFLQKPLAVEVPIWIAHPLSLPNSAHRFAADERARLAPPAPEQHPPSAMVHRVPSMNQILPPVGAGPAASHASFSPAPSVVQNHLPLPGTPLPNTPSTGYAQSSISMASSISSPAMWPPSSPAPYFPPPPAAPAELYDPLAPVWQTSAPPSHPDASYPHYAGIPHSQTMQQVPHYAHHPAEPARSPAPAAYWDGHAQSPHHQQYARQTEYRPEGGVTYATAPVPYLASATPAPGASSFGIPQYTPPLPCPSPIPQRRSPDPPQTPATPPPPPAPRSRTPLRTPPPPSPSAAYRPSPSTSPAPDKMSVASQLCAADAPGLLETIGEDGESQAGTAKSAMLPSGLTDALRAPGPSNASTKAETSSKDNSPGRNSVQDLEELVEAAEQALEQTRAQSPSRNCKAEAEAASEPADKALPALPSQRPSARSIFAHDSSASSERSNSSPAPASPMRTASSSPPKREPGGLAALQARLARSTPPAANASPKMSPRPEASRSPSPTKPLLDPTPNALRNVSALRARSISRASRAQQAVREAEEEDPREVVRRVRARSGLAPISIADLANLAALETNTATLSLSTPEPPSSTSGKSDAEKSPRLAGGLTSPPLSPRRPLPSPPQAPGTTSSIIDAPLTSSISPTPAGSAQVNSSSPAQSPRRPVFRSRSPPVTEAVSSVGSSEEADTEPRKTGEVSSSSSKAEERASPPKKASSPSPWSRTASPWSPRLPHRAATTPDPTPPPPMVQPRSDSVPAVDRAGRKVVNFEEMKELKQEAVQRVTGWLDVGGEGTADLSLDHGQLEPSPRSPATRYVPSNLSGPNARAPSLKAVSSTEFSDRTRSSSRSSARDVSEPTVAQLIAAETRAAMRKSQQDRTGSLSSVTSVQKGLNGYLAALEQDASFERDAQAHKSAKVAKPGKVRSVASIWAERVEEAERTPPLGHRSTKSFSALQAADHETNVAQPLARVDNDVAAVRRRPVSLYSSSAAASDQSSKLPRDGVSTPSSSSAPSRKPVTPSSPATRTFSASPVPASPRKDGARVADLLARYQQQI